MLVVGCVTSSTTYYTPTPGETRLRPDDARTQLDAFVAIECPRLLQAGRSISKDGLIAVDLDPQGLVTRSRVETTIGDKRIDDIFGAVAAKLRFDPPPGATADVSTGRIRAGYACSEKAAVATLEPLGR